jgi:hypothetical protein
MSLLSSRLHLNIFDLNKIFLLRFSGGRKNEEIDRFGANAAEVFHKQVDSRYIYWEKNIF